MNRITGIRDLDREILLRIDDDDTFLNMRCVNKYLCSFFNENFYERRMKYKYPQATRSKKEIVYTWKDFYLKTVSIVEKLEKDHQIYFYMGDPRKYLRLLSFNDAKWYRGYYMGKHNCRDLIFLLQPRDYTYAFDGASSKGHWKMIKELISRHEFSTQDYNDALCNAIRENRRDIIDYFISLGANDWQEFINEAAQYNHEDLIALFKSKI